MWYTLDVLRGITFLNMNVKSSPKIENYRQGKWTKTWWIFSWQVADMAGFSLKSVHPFCHFKTRAPHLLHPSVYLKYLYKQFSAVIVPQNKVRFISGYWYCLTRKHQEIGNCNKMVWSEFCFLGKWEQQQTNQGGKKDIFFSESSSLSHQICLLPLLLDPILSTVVSW